MSSPTQARTQIVLLGTGTPNAEPDRAGSSTAILVDDTPYLIDCGPGVVRRANAAFRQGHEALHPRKLAHAFVTHLHSDHTAGYADLILTPWVLGRSVPLRVYGPPGIRAMTDHLRAAYDADIRERLDGLEPANPTGHHVIASEIAPKTLPGVCFQDERVTVEAFAVDHGSWPAFGFKFTTPDRTIVHAGDTAPVPELLEYMAGCDVLIHEVYSETGLQHRPGDWQRYHRAVHTSSAQLAALATQARPGLLILTHQLFWGTSTSDLLAEIRAGYDGPVVSGNDLDVF